MCCAVASQLDLPDVMAAQFNLKKLAHEFDSYFLDNPAKERRAQRILCDEVRAMQQQRPR